MVTERFDFSERRACRLCDQNRATQRYRPKRRGDDCDLRSQLRDISDDHPRWGYRRAHGHLVNQGHVLNRKRIQRLWREEGLRVPQRKRKRSRIGTSDVVPGELLAAEHPNHVWALDFQFDSTADGRMLKLLNVVDEFTREALGCEVERSITADDTVAVLERLVAQRGAPKFIRCDNGPELTADALRIWCTLRGAGTSFIEPGSPWQNPYVESFNGRMRDEVLDTELFYELAEAKVIVADWRGTYNAEHPHSSLGMRPPAAFAEAWRAEHSTELSA